MNQLNGILATCFFELKRMWTFQRLGIFVVLSSFPPLIVLFLLWGSLFLGETQTLNFLLLVIIFLVAIVGMLSLLLWAPTNIYSELEGKSWGFIASRPGGRISILFGKYLAAVIQSYAICQFALVGSFSIAVFGNAIRDPIVAYLVLSVLALLACICIGAVMSLIGVQFYRRAMVTAAAYLVGIELVVATIPAIVGKFTVRQHLQDLGLNWLSKELPLKPTIYYNTFGDYADWLNLLCLAAITIFSLSAAAYIIQRREYLIGDEA